MAQYPAPYTAARFCIVCGKANHLKNLNRNTHLPELKLAVEIFSLDGLFKPGSPGVYICKTCKSICTKIILLKESSEECKARWHKIRNGEVNVIVKPENNTRGSNGAVAQISLMNKGTMGQSDIKKTGELGIGEGDTIGNGTLLLSSEPTLKRLGIPTQADFEFFKTLKTTTSGPYQFIQKATQDETPESLVETGVNSKTTVPDKPDPKPCTLGSDHAYMAVPISDLLDQHQYYRLVVGIDDYCTLKDKSSICNTVNFTSTWKTLAKSLMAIPMLRRAIESFLIIEVDCALERLSLSQYPSVLRSKNQQMGLDGVLGKLLSEVKNEVPFLVSFLVGVCTPVHRKIDCGKMIGLICGMGLFNRNFQLSIVQRILTAHITKYNATNELISFLHKLGLTLASKHKIVAQSGDNNEHPYVVKKGMKSSKNKGKSNSKQSKTGKKKRKKMETSGEEEVNKGTPQTVIVDRDDQYWTSGGIVETEGCQLIAEEEEVDGQTVIRFRIL